MQCLHIAVNQVISNGQPWLNKFKISLSTIHTTVNSKVNIHGEEKMPEQPKIY